MYPDDDFEDIPLYEIKGNSIYIFTELDHPSKYTGLIEFINDAEEGEELNLHLQCNGGVLDTALIIANAINTSPAIVRCVVAGSIGSGATIIFMACPKRSVTPYSKFLFHYPFVQSATGSLTELHSLVKRTQEQFDSIFDTYYKEVLSEEERKRMQAGEDIYLTGLEIQEIQPR